MTYELCFAYHSSAEVSFCFINVALSYVPRTFALLRQHSLQNSSIGGNVREAMTDLSREVISKHKFVRRI